MPPIYQLWNSNLNISVSLPACVDFGSLFDLEHDLPDELISSSDLGLTNGGDASQLHTSLGGVGGGIGVGGGQDAAAKHKQLSELLRAGAPAQQGVPVPNSTAPGASMGMMGGVGVAPGGPQGMPPQGQQPQPGLMQQVGMVGGVAALNRAAAMMGAQKGNAGQQQPGLMGGQVMNGSPRMGYPGNAGLGNNSNLLAETLQQQGGQPMGPGGQAGMRPQQPGALNKVRMDEATGLIRTCTLQLGSNCHLWWQKEKVTVTEANSLQMSVLTECSVDAPTPRSNTMILNL